MVEARRRWSVETIERGVVRIQRLQLG